MIAAYRDREDARGVVVVHKQTFASVASNGVRPLRARSQRNVSYETRENELGHVIHITHVRGGTICLLH